ncbi:lipopolysaccharide biosynthesis protein [Vibrio coralliirubri]|uniref:lipopolysaccharide biosynthesis protein n=1 Tax=Vibrio coralliirubri TaxID=1516159 RepID=UPI00069A0739|nr:oligosaccharide flippase family protein [Vibrio coralliirubri]
MKENISKNIVFTLIITILTTFLSFLMNKYLLNILGDDELGLFRLLSQMIFYLALLDLGISTSATVAYYKPLIENDKKKISVIYSTIEQFYKKVSILTVILGVLLIPLLIYIIDFNSYKMLSIYWLIFVFNAAAAFLMNKYVILFLADQKVFFVKAVTGVALLLERAFQIVLIVKFESFLLFICAGILSNVIKFVFFKMKMKKQYHIIESGSEYDANIKSDAGKMFFHKLSHIVLYNTDNIIIAKFISLSAVAAYSSYLMLTSLVMTIVSIFHSVVDPIVGQLIVKQKNIKNYDLWYVLFRFSFWVAGFTSLGFYYFATPFIHNWLGDQLTLSQIIVAFLLVNLFFDIIKWPTEILKYKYAYYKDIYNPIIEVFVNLALSLYLVRIYGLAGVIWGTIVVNLISNLIVKPIIVFRCCLNMSIYKYVKSFSFAMCEMVFTVFIVHYIFSNLKLLSDGISSSWVDFLWTVILFSLVYIIVWFLSISVFRSINTLVQLYSFIKNKRL